MTSTTKEPERDQKRKTPQEIYAAALVERESDEPLERRQACEKAFLAALEAVDEFLATKGIFVPKGHPEAHRKRADCLDEFVKMDPSNQDAWDLRGKFAQVKEHLHGHCFYGGSFSPVVHDRDLKKTVREILEITGHLERDA